MDLERNLIDNILECEIKLGHASMPIVFYYPMTSLTDLLACQQDQLPQAFAHFQKQELGRLGQVTMEELAYEKGRFGVSVPASGVDWVYKNYKPSEFMKAFVTEIKKPGNQLEDIVDLFKGFSPEVEVRKNNEYEWAVFFKDEAVDPYVYHIEQNDFGLEYHRFTRQAYRAL